MQPATQSSHVGAILQSRRKALKLSQAQLAAKLGLSQNRLSELETRPHTLTVEQLLALLNLLGLELVIRERASAGKP